MSALSKRIASNIATAHEGFQLLREYTDPRLHGVLDSLEDAHVAALQSLDTSADLNSLLDLNLRAIAERIS